MNNLEELREDIERHFDYSQRIPDSCEVSTSPSGHYRFKSVCYESTCPVRNWVIAEIEVTDLRSDKIIHRFRRNDDNLFYAWVAKSGREYLLLSEDLEGQSVLDLELRQFASHASDDDAFIWCSFHLSPDGRFLAIGGCVWACPSMVTIYDFTTPLNLPLPKVAEYWSNCDIDFECWIDDTSFKLSAPINGEQIHRIPVKEQRTSPNC